MFISQALAQGTTEPALDLLTSLLPFALIAVVVFFFLRRRRERASQLQVPPRPSSAGQLSPRLSSSNFAHWNQTMPMPQAPRLLGTVIFSIAFLIVWEILALTAANPFLLPGLERVLPRMVTLFTESAMFQHLAASCRNVAGGLIFAAIVSIGTGAFARSREAVRVPLLRIAAMMSTMPFVAVTPLLILWFGIGDSSKIASAFLCALFPMWERVLTAGTYATPQTQLFALGNQPARAVPSADPTMSDAGGLPITGTLRVGFPFAVGGMLVIELLSGGSGLGVLIVQAMQLLDIDMLFAIILVVFLLTGLVMGLLRSFETRAMRST